MTWYSIHLTNGSNLDTSLFFKPLNTQEGRVPNLLQNLLEIWVTHPTARSPTYIVTNDLPPSKDDHTSVELKAGESLSQWPAATAQFCRQWDNGLNQQPHIQCWAQGCTVLHISFCGYCLLRWWLVVPWWLMVALLRFARSFQCHKAWLCLQIDIKGSLQTPIVMASPQHQNSQQSAIPWLPSNPSTSSLQHANLPDFSLGLQIQRLRHNLAQAQKQIQEYKNSCTYSVSWIGVTDL